jgi:coatomer subunit beta'
MVCGYSHPTANRLNYYVGGEVVTIAHLERSMFILGFLPTTNRIYLADKDLTVITYEMHLSVLQYQTAVMRGDLEAADKVMPRVYFL